MYILPHTIRITGKNMQMHINQSPNYKFTCKSALTAIIRATEAY